MEFLLINHPLDCPICDQGGECQLQDLAMGYGGSSSRYAEEKRVVFHKPVGPLISAEEMSRCIHCTRCVRFGQEIAGIMELGMAGRGEHSEIMSFVGRGVESELSGNMIDVCPVGALTSKPFRYSARTWELSRRRSVAPHDSLGSNVVVQIKQNTVMRVLPFENESINECWLSDRDRFAYEGLGSSERLERPMVRAGGQWREADWAEALAFAADALKAVRERHGAASIGALGSPQATVEELHLLARLARGLGSENVDCRPRVADPTLVSRLRGVPWLGMPVEAVGALDRLLLVGSFLRKDQPLLAARVRAAVKRGARVAVLHAVDDDLLMPLAAKAVIAPSRWAQVLAGAWVATLQGRGESVPAELAGVEPDDAGRALAAVLATGSRKAVLLGAAVGHHPEAGVLAALAAGLAGATGATLGWLGEGANAVGGPLAGALPGAGGLDAAAMMKRACKGYLLVGVEPALDHGHPAAATAALAQAEAVVALSAFRSAELLESASCLLPITPFTETGGTFVNLAGTVQSFSGVVRPRGEARPGWKVLRVLGNALGVPGFDFDTVEQVRAQALPDDVAARLSNAIDGSVRPTAAGTGVERIADVPIYAADPIVRRAPSLQQTPDAGPPALRAAAATLQRLGLAAGDRAWVGQGGGSVVLEVVRDDRVAEGAVRVAAAHPLTRALGPMIGPVDVERA
jgi:NADH-quinone oxidoreductase subunit G